MNKIIINGKEFTVSGSNISVINGKVFVDGKLIEEGLTDNVTISFVGDLASLSTNGSATIHGNVNGNVDVGGSVTCGNISGSLNSGGSVACLEVGGNINAGGSVKVSKEVRDFFDR